jgi:RNA polymerase sporulation-specific sigma factor
VGTATIEGTGVPTVSSQAEAELEEAFANPPEIARSTDEDLLEAYRGGSTQAAEELLSRYRSLARARARSFFLPGADHDDLAQEAMIGIYKAIRDYNASREASFRTFAEVCISRQLCSAVRAGTRLKHSALNASVSLEQPVGGPDEGRTVMDVIPGSTSHDPAEIVVSREAVAHLRGVLHEILSDFESEVLRLHLEGVDYQAIAVRMDRTPKAIDNALQRLKRKVADRLATVDA